MLQFQPTELVKISLILFVAVFIAELGTRINKLRPTLVIIGFFSSSGSPGYGE